MACSFGKSVFLHPRLPNLLKARHDSNSSECCISMVLLLYWKQLAQRILFFFGVLCLTTLSLLFFKFYFHAAISMICYRLAAQLMTKCHLFDVNFSIHLILYANSSTFHTILSRLTNILKYKSCQKCNTHRNHWHPMLHFEASLASLAAVHPFSLVMFANWTDFGIKW